MVQGHVSRLILWRRGRDAEVSFGQKRDEIRDGLALRKWLVSRFEVVQAQCFGSLLERAQITEGLDKLLRSECVRVIVKACAGLLDGLLQFLHSLCSRLAFFLRLFHGLGKQFFDLFSLGFIRGALQCRRPFKVAVLD
jgi:hypothetical protein